jgi:hypothetical protein
MASLWRQKLNHCCADLGYVNAPDFGKYQVTTSTSRIETMRICEILFYSDQPAEEDHTGSELDFPRGPFSNDLRHLAGAFTKHGILKHFWNLNGSQDQPSGPAPPNAGTELIPSGTLEPSTASRQAEPVEIESPDGLHRAIPFRRYRVA